MHGMNKQVSGRLIGWALALCYGVCGSDEQPPCDSSSCVSFHGNIH